MSEPHLSRFLHACLWLVTFSCFNFVVSGLHLSGTWHSSEFFRFLTKFGIQKTDPGKLDDTQGFIYGNITVRESTDSSFTLVLADSSYFLELYENQSKNRTLACDAMFSKMNKIAFDRVCNLKGVEDFLRKIPCPKDNLCVDEDNPSNLIPGYQFTYKVQNNLGPRFWYLSLVACSRNTSKKNCHWNNNNSARVELDYDIWLVNGDPASKHLNPFEHQFSFELHDVFEIYLIFLVLYSFVLPIWIYAYKRQIHPITKLLTVCIAIEYAGIFLNFIQVLIFSFNGVGASWLRIIGNLLGTFAECLFMLLLLLIARGWTITTMVVKSKIVLFAVWGLYTAINLCFFIWNLTEVDIIYNIDEWNSWPGFLIVGFRMLIMVWFIVELRQTFRNSKHQNRLDFFQQFGAYFLVWFIYLPILVAVATQISYLWRYKTILSITYAADLLSYVVLIHLLWPSRSVLYLINKDDFPAYELEVSGMLDDMDETKFTPKNIQSQPLNIAERETSPPPKKEKDRNSSRTSHPMTLEKHNNGYTNISLDDDEEEVEEFEML